MARKRTPQPPVAHKEKHVIMMHGRQHEDDHFWMRLSEEEREMDPPSAKAARVIQHLQAENAYTEAVLAPIMPFKDQLYLEMKGRIKETDMSVPYRENGYWYSYRSEEGKEYVIHQRRKDVPGAVDEVFFDENTMAEGTEYFDLADLEVAPGNGLLAYSVDLLGRRIYDLRFRDLHTGEDLPDVIENTAGGCAWADDRTVFYARKDATLRSASIHRHVLGTDQSTDVEVFRELDTAFSCEVYRCRSDRYVIINTESSLSSEHWLLSTNDPLGVFQVFLKREDEHEHSIFHSPEHDGEPGEWHILTNWRAPNFRLMRCWEDRTEKADWVEVIAHRDMVLLEEVDVFKDFLVLGERREGLTHLRVLDKRSGSERDIAFEDPVYVVHSGTNPEWDSHVLRYGYASMTRPMRVMEHDMRTGTDRVLKQQEVLGPFDPNDLVSERVWAEAPDGVRIPMSVVRRKTTALNGTAPLLIYGYGAYGISMEPGFSSTRLSLLDRGFVFVIAHIRGGEELGRWWYDGGRMENKMNSFTDMVACAETLLANGHADRERLFCMGGSAGGLLVGAVVNMRPDLWKAVVAEVPFVDVVNTMLDDTLPLTTGEYDEWGDPSEREAYERMLSYSPYDNVHDANYPAMFIATGFHDSQVQYWEPAKWVARLREHQQGDAPILLHINMEAGHGGASGRYERLKEVALDYSFLLWQAGLDGRE